MKQNVKDFFLIEMKESNNNLLFHAPSLKFAHIPNDLKISNHKDEDIYNQFKNLKNHEYKFSKRVFGKGKIGITFMAARTCNLACSYCYAGEGEYGNIETKPKYINKNLYLDSIKFLNKIYEGIKSINFFGGEPLLYYKTIEEVIPLIENYFNSIGENIPKIAVSTNGTLIDEHKLNFFKKHNISLALSLDGVKEINDLARVSKNNDFSVYDRIAAVTDLLKEKEIYYAVQVTINKNHINLYEPGKAKEWIKNLEELGFYNMAIVPVETDDKNLMISGEEDYIKLDLISREITNYFLDKLYIEDSIVKATGIISPLLQIANKKYVDTCSSGHSVFVDTDGKIYPCQLFCSDDSFAIGEVNSQNLSEKKVNYFSNIQKTDCEKCNSCITKRICSFWCKGINYQMNNNMYYVTESRCIFQRANVEECIKKLSTLDKKKGEYKIFWDNVYKSNNWQRNFIPY